MKVTKSFSIDLEVALAMEKRKLGSEWVNRVLRKALLEEDGDL